MLRILRKPKSLPIGVDLGTENIKLAQLRYERGRLELVAIGSVQFPQVARKNPAARAKFVIEAIRQLLHEHPFQGRQCVMSLPAEATFVQHIKMAKMSSEQLSSALQWELQGKLPYDPSHAIIRHIVAGDIFSGEEIRQEIIVLAASRDVVESHIDLARRAKLDCVGINLEPCAIIECFARLFRRAEDDQRTTLFIDIGAQSTQVVIGHGPHLAFARNLLLGGHNFDRAVAKGLGIPLDQANQMRLQASAGDGVSDATTVYNLLTGPLDNLADEITKCLRYHESVFHNRQVERAVFLGGQAHDKRLCQMVAQRIGLPAQIGDPLAHVRRADEDAREAEKKIIQPSWAVAAGLSLGAAGTRQPVAAAP